MIHPTVVGWEWRRREATTYSFWDTTWKPMSAEHCMRADNNILTLKGMNKSIIGLGIEFIFEKNEHSIWLISPSFKIGKNLWTYKMCAYWKEKNSNYYQRIKKQKLAIKKTINKITRTRQHHTISPNAVKRICYSSSLYSSLWSLDILAQTLICALACGRGLPDGANTNIQKQDARFNLNFIENNKKYFSTRTPLAVFETYLTLFLNIA